MTDFMKAMIIALALFGACVAGIGLMDAYGETNMHDYPGNVDDICYTDILDNYPDAYEALCGTSPDAKKMNSTLAKD